MKRAFNDWTRFNARARAFRALVLSGGAIIAIAGSTAHAEVAGSAGAPEAAADPADPEGQSSGLSEITVTARRTSENVQTTPVSVTAISTQEIANLDITRLEAVQQLTPNLTVVQNGPSSVAPMLYLRGIGSPSVALYSEPPVGLYVDGVYTPRPTAAAFDLPDLEGAEVLRGPQGTLFGRNTTGGAILLRTQAPTADAGGKVRFSYGSNNEVIASAVIQTGELGSGGPRIKLVGQIHDRDGWVKFPGYKANEWGGSLHSRAISGTIAQDFGAFRIENAANYNHLRSAVGWQTLVANPNAAAYFAQNPGGPPVLISTKPLDIAYRSPLLKDNEAWIEAWGDRLTLSYDGGKAFQVKSITAYSELKENLTGQLGGSYVQGSVNRLGVPTLESVITHVTPYEPGHQNQFSQEFNFTGTLGDFSYVAGLYYFRESVGETIQTVQMSAPASATAAVTLTDRRVTYSGTTDSYAAYGQVSYKPSALDGRLEVSGGLRFTHDKKKVSSFTAATSSATGVTTYTGTVAATGVPGAGTSGIIPSKLNDKWENTGWSASLSYEVTPALYLFARASSAFRAGGFNAGATNAPSYGPEKAVSYEGGFKSEWFDRHVRLNVVGYHTDYDGLQINQYFGPPRNTNYITNAGRAQYEGVEAEFTARFGGFQVDADYGRIWPKYKEYLIGALPLPAICATNPSDSSCFQNVANVARFGFLSQTSFHAGLQYETAETPIGVVTLRADYSFKSSFRFGTLDLLSPNNTKVESGSAKNLSARIILSKIPVGGSNVSVQVFGDNLTNHRYIIEAVDFSTTMNGIFNRPRNFGVILTADF